RRGVDHPAGRGAEEPGDPVSYHLWYGAERARNDRSAAGHRLGHDETEGLRPVDGEQQRPGSPKPVTLHRLWRLVEDQHIVAEAWGNDLVPVRPFGRLVPLDDHHERQLRVP